VSADEALVDRETVPDFGARSVRRLSPGRSARREAPVALGTTVELDFPSELGKGILQGSDLNRQLPRNEQTAPRDPRSQLNVSGEEGATVSLGPGHHVVVGQAANVLRIVPHESKIAGEAAEHFVGQPPGLGGHSKARPPGGLTERRRGAIPLWGRSVPSTPVRLFGTNGIREVVGGPLTAPFVTSIVGAIGHVLPPGLPIVVGWDGRTASPAMARLASGTLALAGHQVIEVGVLPTPAVQYNVVKLQAQFGVILTASHNPPEFDGIKCISGDGLEATRSVEEAIERSVADGTGAAVPFDRVGDIRTDSEGARRYVEGILQQVDSAAIARRKLTVVLDCGNGASVPTSPTLLRRLGCRVITINGHLDGTFPGHLSEPTEANLADLRATVPAVGAHLGIAHDGDADRAVFVDHAGNYLPGERILTLLAREFVRRAHGGVVVTPVSASQSVEDAVRPLGGEVVYTRVGSPVVTREMLARHALFGGEENGGLIFPSFQLARDGAMTAAAVLDLMARHEVTLADAVRDLPVYSLIKEKVGCPIERREEVLRRVTAEVIRAGDRVLTLDGVKVFRSDGWILLRPSGTEPLIRVFAEARDEPTARRLAHEGLSLVGKILASPADA